MTRGLACLVVAATVTALHASAQSTASDAVAIRVLSNRADLVSSGDALVEIVSPAAPVDSASSRVLLGDRDVTAAFTRTSDGRFIGLVDGLRVGPNDLEVRAGDRVVARATLVNHPRGGPIFSGPQLWPWVCTTTAEPSLGEPIDAQCNAATRTRYVYRSTAGRFEPFDPAGPAPADMAVVQLDGGTMPYVVRIERGTMNRGIHEVAVLFDPSKPWTPVAPQPQWQRKLLLVFGGGTGQIYRQGNPAPVLHDEALRRGFAVASSSMLVNGQHANFVTAAETSMMLKEHVIETYGELRFTVGEGGSGGALLQYLVADAYPGILDGLRPTQDWQDSISGAYREFVDSAVIMHAIESSDLEYTTEHRAAIGGWGGTNVTVFNTESRRVVDYIRPDDGTRCAGDDSYDPVSRPDGVRCTFQDFMASVIGRRSDGAAHQVYDNVGVQYGLLALEAGQISAEQFVDLNARAGGFDHDGRWQPQRNAMDREVVARLYRTGQILEGRGLARVPIVAIRGTNNDDYHYPYRTVVNRARLIAANGHADNHVYWIQPPRGTSTLDAIDRWLTAVQLDGGPGDLPAKVVRNRPADVVSGCWIDGAHVTDLARCDQVFPYEREPRTTAGDGPTISTMKCELKPVVRADYGVAFTDTQWTRLVEAFPSGVCDFSRPGVGVERTTTWFDYGSDSRPGM